jgi:hypothetical protein
MLPRIQVVWRAKDNIEALEARDVELPVLNVVVLHSDVEA